MKIFVASTGRCGTMFMAEVFRELTGIPSFHEPLPYCVGKTLEEVNDRDAYGKDTTDELTRKLEQVKRCSIDGDYFESSQMFIKGYAELMVRAFRRVYVIYLYRNPIDVALSYAEKCRDYEADWFLKSHWKKNVLRTSAPMAFFDTVIWQCYEVRERFLEWRGQFTKTYEFAFERLNDPEEWERLFECFGIKHKPFSSLPQVRTNAGVVPTEERMARIRAEWGREATMKTEGNPTYYDVPGEKERFLVDRSMQFARLNRCSLT